MPEVVNRFYNWKRLKKWSPSSNQPVSENGVLIVSQCMFFGPKMILKHSNKKRLVDHWISAPLVDVVIFFSPTSHVPLNVHHFSIIMQLLSSPSPSTVWIISTAKEDHDQNWPGWTVAYNASSLPGLALLALEHPVLHVQHRAHVLGRRPLFKPAFNLFWKPVSDCSCRGGPCCKRDTVLDCNCKQKVL